MGEFAKLWSPTSKTSRRRAFVRWRWTILSPTRTCPRGLYEENINKLSGQLGEFDRHWVSFSPTEKGKRKPKGKCRPNFVLPHRLALKNWCWKWYIIRVMNFSCQTSYAEHYCAINNLCLVSSFSPGEMGAIQSFEGCYGVVNVNDEWWFRDYP